MSSDLYLYSGWRGMCINVLCLRSSYMVRLVGYILATLVCTFMHNVAHIFLPVFSVIIK
jgi:hypothetical protein